MKAETNCNWFVEPTGDPSRSNEKIAYSLPDETDGSMKRCSDGKDHYLWSCSFSEAKKLWDSRRSMQIDLKIWCQEGKGEIKPHTFLLKRKKSTITRIGKQVAEMVARRKACLRISS